jgi:hypothetical protein
MQASKGYFTSDTMQVLSYILLLSPSQTLTNTKGQGLQVLTVIDGKLMTITYAALEDLFDRKLPEVDAMIDSIKIMGAR